MRRKFNVIVCPKCGREYLPQEIFIPQSFFGKSNVIVRDEDGKIQTIDGTSLDLNEKYQRDNCNTVFDVEAKITFTTYSPELDFEEEYTRKLGSAFILKET